MLSIVSKQSSTAKTCRFKRIKSTKAFYRTFYSKGYNLYYIALIIKAIRSKERRFEKFRRTDLILKVTRREENQADFEINIEEKLKKRIPNQN